MTISSENRKSGPYDGNDVTTSFPFSFKVFSDDEVVVVFTDEDGVETILSSGYSVTLNADQNANPGGSVEKSTALETGAMLTITSAVQNLQPIDLTNNGGFYPAVINQAFDRLTILAQQNAEQISRAVKTPISSGMTPDELLASIASSDSAAAASASEAAASASDALSYANDAEASAVASAASVDALADDLASTDDGKGAALVSFNDPLAPTYLKTLSDIANGSEVSLFRFVSPTKHSSIRAGTDTSDLLTSFQDAAAAAKAIFIPWGAYYVSGTTNISKDGAKWRGEGISGSKIIGTVNNLPLFTIASGLNGVTLEEFQLSRNVTAITGGDGIKSSTGSIGQATIRRLLIEKQNNGLSLGPTDWSEVEKIIIQKCQNVGVFVTNTATDGACQWSFDSVLSQMNGGQGFMVQTAAGPAQMTVGTFKSCATFANSAVGMAFIGSSGVPLQGVRIIGGFIGEDANHEIYLDTYGDQHVIDGTFIELAGSRTTGPTLSTAASSVGCGVAVTANNTGVQLTGVHSNGNSQDGFFLNGVTHLLGNCRATNNGIALGSGRRNGVYSTAGRVIITGGRYGNTGAGTSQQYGAYVNDGNNLSIGFADLNGNSSAAWSAAANTAYVTSIGNLPNNLNVGLSPAGAVLVGAGATGGFTAAGTINVAGGLLKNNTAYSNP